MMTNHKINEAARLLGSRGGKAPKTITAADRQRRRDWARGLAKIREAKRAAMPAAQVIEKRRFVVIARDGSKSLVEASTGGKALELARSNGVDAVGVRQERNTQ